MLYREHSNAARPCQCPDVASGHIATPAAPAPPATPTPSASPSIVAWARTGPVEVGRVVDAVTRAYNETHPAAAGVTTTAAILGKSRLPDVAWARHLCAYLLVEDATLSNIAAAQALGRVNHTTILNSRARVAAALGHDTALAATLTRARAMLAGEEPVSPAAGEESVSPARRARSRPYTFAGATARELAEYRYWRQRSVQMRSAW